MTDADKFKSESGGFWLGGCNTSLEPESIPSAPYPQYAWGENIDNSRGQLSTRDGFDQVLTLPGGKPQMLAHFRTSNNWVDYAVCVVSGQVYVSPAPFTQWRNLGVSLDGNVNICTHTIVERGAKRTEEDGDGKGRELICPKRYIVIQDGKNPAVAWDGGYVVNRPPEIPIGKWMAYVNNRLFVSVGEEIFWSDIADPFSFYDMGFLADGGQFRLRSPVTGLAMSPDGQSLLAFETDACWRFLVSTQIKRENDWKTTPGFQTKILNGVGCLAGNSFVEHYGDLWWWSNKDLISFRRALSVNTEDELNQTDLEMSRSRNKFGNIQDDVCGISHLNYLLVNTPVNEIWAKNNSPASLLNTNTSPAWMGIWTGLRVKEFASFYSNGELYTLALSHDYDNKTRLWRLFNGRQEDNTNRIKCAYESRAHSFSAVTQMKRIRWFDFMIQRIWGDVDIKGWFRGLRGGWNQALEKAIKSAKALDEYGGKVLQFRRLYSEDVAPEGLDCQNCGQESNLIDTIDFAFQIQLQWEGECSLDNYRLAAFIETEQLTGQCETDEVVPAVVNNCLPALNYRPTYFEQPTNTVNVPFQQDLCDGASPMVAVTVSSLNTPTDTNIIKNQIQGSQCPCTAMRSFTSTQTATANCVVGDGAIVTKTATATSSISQYDADKKALAQAQALADAELHCTWTSTETVTVQCAVGLMGQPVTKTASYTSTISQKDADEHATAMATNMANHELICSAPVDFVRIGGIGGGLGPNMGNIGLYKNNGSPSNNWQGSAGTDGIVYGMAENPAFTYVVGDFNKYNGANSYCLVKMSRYGVRDSSFANSFYTNTGARSASVVCAVGVNGYDQVALGGLFTHWRGVAAENFVIVNGTTGAKVSTAFPGADGLIRKVIKSGNGWIIIGDFNNIGTNARPYIARLNGDGSLDTAFLPNDSGTEFFGPNGPVDSICAKGTGFMVSGRFSMWGKTIQKGITELTAIGTLNSFFNYSGDPINGIAQVAYDGRYIYVGFSGKLSRVQLSGVIDPIYPNISFDGDLNAIIINGLNYILLGGFKNVICSFGETTITSQGQFACLLNKDGIINTQFNYNEATGRGWFGNTLYAGIV
jgi:hypothetical protein